MQLTCYATEHSKFVPCPVEDPFTVFTLSCGLKFGVLICYNLCFPEAFRILKSRGADLVVLPTASRTPIGSTHTAPVRAYESHIHVLYSNFARQPDLRGEEFDDIKP